MAAFSGGARSYSVDSLASAALRPKVLQFRVASVGALRASPPQEPVSELISGSVGIMLRPPDSQEGPDYIASSGQARAKEAAQAQTLLKLPLLHVTGPCSFI